MDQKELYLPNFQDVLNAQSNLKGLVHRTPLLASSLLTDHVSAKGLWFKCENLQRTGSFKARGATNAVLKLSEERNLSGVATHSSGNHGAALAAAARNLEIPAYVVIPEDVSSIKKSAILAYDASVTECGSSLAAREQVLSEVIKRTGAREVHPYDDASVIAGQGTVALEVLEEIPNADILLIPVGGGGLLSGCALAAKQLKPDLTVIGVEPVGADDAARSFRAGKIIPQKAPDTIADGLLTSLGSRNFPIIQKYVDDIETVDDRTILKAMHLMWTRLKQVVEPSGAVSYAALLNSPTRFLGKNIVAVVSGGNVDPARLPR